jgi:hypothetical protein
MIIFVILLNKDIMQKENVEQIIRELFRENLRLYPESYPLTNQGGATQEASESVEGVASGYWDNRDELEVQRDQKLAITRVDYLEWCMNEFLSEIASAI